VLVSFVVVVFLVVSYLRYLFKFKFFLFCDKLQRGTSPTHTLIDYTKFARPIKFDYIAKRFILITNFLIKFFAVPFFYPQAASNNFFLTQTTSATDDSSDCRKKIQSKILRIFPLSTAASKSEREQQRKRERESASSMGELLSELVVRAPVI